MSNKSESVIRRIVRYGVALLLVYYIWILVSVWSMGGWWWNLEAGLTWSSSPSGRFLPIPALPGMFAMISHASLIDNVFYLVFMHNGRWMAWVALGLLYLFSPYRMDIRLLLDKARTRLHDRSQNETR